MPEHPSITYPALGTSDAVESIGNASCEPTSGDLFPLGMTTITARTIDSSGNTSTCTCEVNVLDRLPSARRRVSRCIILVFFLASANWLALGQQSSPQAQETPYTQSRQSSIGREVSVPVHLQDGQEFSLPLDKLLAHGLLLFNANWTEQ